ncbi:hypothetical protein ACFL0V_03885, partial [Nanoarchaeota archaeon]
TTLSQLRIYDNGTFGYDGNYKTPYKFEASDQNTPDPRKHLERILTEFLPDDMKPAKPKRNDPLRALHHWFDDLAPYHVETEFLDTTEDGDGGGYYRCYTFQKDDQLLKLHVGACNPGATLEMIEGFDPTYEGMLDMATGPDKGIAHMFVDIHSVVDGTRTCTDEICFFGDGSYDYTGTMGSVKGSFKKKKDYVSQLSDIVTKFLQPESDSLSVMAKKFLEPEEFDPLRYLHPFLESIADRGIRSETAKSWTSQDDCDSKVEVKKTYFIDHAMAGLVLDVYLDGRSLSENAVGDFDLTKHGLNHQFPDASDILHRQLSLSILPTTGDSENYIFETDGSWKYRGPNKPDRNQSSPQVLDSIIERLSPPIKEPSPDDPLAYLNEFFASVADQKGKGGVEVYPRKEETEVLLRQVYQTSDDKEMRTFVATVHNAGPGLTEDLYNGFDLTRHGLTNAPYLDQHEVSPSTLLLALISKSDAEENTDMYVFYSDGRWKQLEGSKTDRKTPGTDVLDMLVKKYQEGESNEPKASDDPWLYLRSHIDKLDHPVEITVDDAFEEGQENSDGTGLSFKSISLTNPDDPDYEMSIMLGISGNEDMDSQALKDIDPFQMSLEEIAEAVGGKPSMTISLHDTLRGHYTAPFAELELSHGTYEMNSLIKDKEVKGEGPLEHSRNWKRHIDTLVHEYLNPATFEFSRRKRDPLTFLHSFMNYAKRLFPKVRCVEDTYLDGSDEEEPMASKYLTYNIKDGDEKRKLEIQVTKYGAYVTKRTILDTDVYSRGLRGISGKLVAGSSTDASLVVSLEIEKDGEKRSECYLVTPSGKWHDLDDGPYEGDEDYRDVLEATINKFLDGENKYQQVLDSTMQTLFTEDEIADLGDKIKDARMSVGRWASIPRLNLGPITLPTPGQNYVNEELFEGGQLLIEYLSQLNVMPREEAEELVTRRLVHHYVHNTDFQYSREKAVELIQALDQNYESSEAKKANSVK